MSRKKLIDAFNYDFSGGGLFSLLTAAAGGVGLPWADAIDDTSLAIEYFGNHSGDKYISPLIAKLLKVDDTETLSTVRQANLALLIYDKYKSNWAKRWTALETIYNPLENYSMTENETESGTNTGTVGNVKSDTISGSKSGTNTGTVTDAGNESITRDNDSSLATTETENIYGFDSSVASPANSRSGQNTASEDESITTTKGNTRTDNLAHAETTNESVQGTETRTDNLAHAVQRLLTRSGNIGVTTSQQMLQSELEIRVYDYFESIYKDIDKVLTIAIY